MPQGYISDLCPAFQLDRVLSAAFHILSKCSTTELYVSRPKITDEIFTCVCALPWRALKLMSDVFFHSFHNFPEPRMGPFPLI